MARGWFGRDARGAGGGPTGAVEHARNDMVSAFLQLDQRLSIIADGVDAAETLGMGGELVRAFAPVRDACYETINRYLALNGSDGPPAPLTDYQQTMSQITDSIRSLDQFYERHQRQIEQARISYAAVPEQAARVRAESDRLAVQFGTLSPEQLSYASVKTAVQQHDQVRLAFEEAQLRVSRGDGDRAVLKARTAAMGEAVKKLQQAIADAPGKANEARSALASVRTRLSAVRNRSERMPEAYSALLREFSVECSKDLVGHDRRSALDLERAASEIDSASRLRDDPESALEAITRARAALAEAEELVDGVTDRLNELRVVRQDPPAAAGRVRFQIRDAQLLAVNLGLVKQWGSVLDAQVLRVDRAVAGLGGRHPDYWGYLVDLRAISDFVTGVVSKMKDEARR